MAKPIKFNLMVDGQSIRTLDELKDNFNIHDVIEYYENGTLLRWLEVRKYHEYAEKLKAIAASVPLEEKAKALFCVFDFPSDDENAQQAIFALVNSKKREQALKELNVNNAAAAKIIENYLAGYEKLKADIKQHSDDEQFIQTALSELSNKYACLLKLNWMDFYAELKEAIPSIADKIANNEAVLQGVEHTVITKDITYAILKKDLKAHATDLSFIKEIVDKIADNFFIEFEQDYKQFFYEIKDSHPLIVYGLLMNKKTHDCLLSGKEDYENTATRYFNNINTQKTFFNDLCTYFSDIPSNIDKECLHYFTRGTSSDHTLFIDEAIPVLIISADEAVIVRQNLYKDEYIEIIDGDLYRMSITTKRLFILLDTLKLKCKRGAQLLYMKIPETSGNTSI